jgi:DNA-binding NarL/FixJ family response regulator
MNTRVLIVDDHEVVREGLKTLMAKLRPKWEIVGEASNGEEGINATTSLKPDIVLLDVTMPRMNGLEACKAMRRLGVSCPVLIFTMHDSSLLADEAEHVGAQGYVVKGEAARYLVKAMDTLLAGGTFFGGASHAASS